MTDKTATTFVEVAFSFVKLTGRYDEKDLRRLKKLARVGALVSDAAPGTIDRIAEAMVGECCDQGCDSVMFTESAHAVLAALKEMADGC